MTRRLLVQLRARLEASPLPLSDSTRLELEAELIELMVATAPTVTAIRVVPLEAPSCARA